MTLLTFFNLQLARILGKDSTHAPGSKKPTLAQQEAGQVK